MTKTKTKNFGNNDRCVMKFYITKKKQPAEARFIISIVIRAHIHICIYVR